MTRSAIPIVIALAVAVACGQQQNDFNDRVVPADSTVADEGRNIVRGAFQELSTNLQEAIEEGGIEHAVEFCSEQAVPLTDSLSTRYGVQIRRASHKPRNPVNRADSLEMITITNYLGQIQDEEELKPYVYETPGGALFHAPIRIAGDRCLNCHGRAGTDITASNLEVIRRIYPEDEATGFVAGELRGIWSVRFPASYFENRD